MNPIVIDIFHVSVEEVGESSLTVLTLDIRAWHVVQLIPPASEPFKPTI